ncbi:MAG: dephospho-CoA kinase [Nitrospirae bacterium]|nr:dephospho-CoA kinase [Nitrospirota bacterium]
MDAMPYIGLTGIFGAGKSSILRIFERLGAFVIDADEIVRDILDNDAAVQGEIARILGADTTAPDGTIDRKQLARIVFADDFRRAQLEALIHPRVFAEAEIRRDRAYAEAHGQMQERMVVFEAPLLVETGYHKRLDALIVIVCPIETALARLEGRGFSRQQSVARMRAQLGQEEKKKEADFIIDNSGTAKEAAIQAAEIYRKITTAPH